MYTYIVVEAAKKLTRHGIELKCKTTSKRFQGFIRSEISIQKGMIILNCPGLSNKNVKRVKVLQVVLVNGIFELENKIPEKILLPLPILIQRWKELQKERTFEKYF